MIVIVAGATSWNDAEAIRRELSRLSSGTTIIHGDSPGADALAGQVAAELGFDVRRLRKTREDYRKYGRGAWKSLNERMLASGAKLVLAFHPDIERSRGTRHLAQLAGRMAVEVRVYAA